MLSANFKPKRTAAASRGFLAQHSFSADTSRTYGTGRLIFPTRRFDCIIPQFRQLHWLKIPSGLTSRRRALCNTDGFTLWCRHTSPKNFAEWPTSMIVSVRAPSRRRRRRRRSSSFIIRCTWLSAVGDRASHSCCWNSLPQHITSAMSFPVFRTRLKIYTSS